MTLRQAVGSGLRGSVRVAARHVPTRAVLNSIYHRLNAAQKEWCHSRFSRMFYENGDPTTPGTWQLIFNQRPIRVPLRPGQFALDWNFALSVLGHDAAVKTTYEHLLQSPTPPEVFVDVGTNYGTHSILFLAAGVETVSFEPNAGCNEYFRALCAINGLTPTIRDIAIGDRRGRVELRFPSAEPWLGSIQTDVAESLATSHRLESRFVELRPLDDFLREWGTRRVVLKIDTEGGEAAVLRGARETLETLRPLIILESWTRDAAGRSEIYDLLATCHYSIEGLPWSPGAPRLPLGREEFVDSRVENFIAVSNLDHAYSRH